MYNEQQGAPGLRAYLTQPKFSSIGTSVVSLPRHKAQGAAVTFARDSFGGSGTLHSEQTSAVSGLKNGVHQRLHTSLKHVGKPHALFLKPVPLPDLNYTFLSIPKAPRAESGLRRDAVRVAEQKFSHHLLRVSGGKKSVAEAIVCTKDVFIQGAVPVAVPN